MGVKIKISLDLKSNLEKARKAASKGLIQIYTEAILSDLSKGVSPVRGKKFPIYSESYKEAIRAGRYLEWNKSIAPINLKLSGVLYESFYCNPTSRGLVIGFSDQVAVYHNDMGAGKSKTIRRLLPTNSGESFNSNIELAVQSYLDRLIFV